MTICTGKALLDSRDCCIVCGFWRFHVEQFASIVAKMAEVKEGAGTLLDNMIFTLGSGISDGSLHVYTDLPTIVAGLAVMAALATGVQVVGVGDSGAQAAWGDQVASSSAAP